jgi:DNA-binding MarR family transcriptional regulator
MMTQRASGEALTDLILEVFRLNGRLLATGDRLVAKLGLTSARWQVFGAVGLADRPMPVAWLARSMGLNRQGVQRIVNELHKNGFVEFQPNPNHRRAQLVILTGRGRSAFDAADALQRPWAEALAERLSPEQIEATTRVVSTLRKRLEGEPAQDG